VRGEFVDLAGVRLYCYAAGSRGRGAPIVLVHDVFASSHVWHDFVPRLPDGHRVLVVDLAGHGRSDPPLALAAGQASLRAHGARLGVLLDLLHVGEAVFVGHGMGAAIVAAHAARWPDRIAALALVAPLLLGAPPPQPLRRLARLTPLWRRLPAAWLASSLHAAIVRGYGLRELGHRSTDLVLRPVRGSEAAGRDAACAQLAALTQPDAPLTADDLAQLGRTLADRGVPIRLIGGANDPWLTTPRLVEAARHLAAPPPTVIPHARHALVEEHPDAVLAALTPLLRPIASGLPTPTFTFPTIPE
jgi:pimeloyl-ACP methyl ester carboxylesterase